MFFLLRRWTLEAAYCSDLASLKGGSQQGGLAASNHVGAGSLNGRLVLVAGSTSSQWRRLLVNACPAGSKSRGQGILARHAGGLQLLQQASLGCAQPMVYRCLVIGE